MLISYDKDRRLFHLHNKDISYYLVVDDRGMLQHLYFGSYLPDIDIEAITYHGIQQTTFLDKETHSEKEEPFRYFHPESSMLEVPSEGGADKRGGMIVIRQKNGTAFTDFRYQDYSIAKGKPLLKGLPSIRGGSDECETLEIKLKDVLSNVYLLVRYSIFSDKDVIVRSARLENGTKEGVCLDKAFSASLDLPDSDYFLCHFPGDWEQERRFVENRLADGKLVIHSNFGFSSHAENPFCILRRPGTDERHGEALSFSLVYSGSFAIDVDVNRWKSTRVSMGLDDEDFAYTLSPNESLQLPEVVMSYSAMGLGKLSRGLHDLIRDNLLKRDSYRKEEQGIVLNSWEDTYFDFDTAKIMKYIGAAKDIGANVFVLDDGWFGHRDNDSSSLGDWHVNTAKIDLSKVVDFCHEKGLRFGIWMEPEMVSPDSDLFRTHPEYALGIPGVDLSLIRHQLILDIGNEKVRDYVWQQIDNLFKKYRIDYLKWDFNRYFTEVYSHFLGSKDQGKTMFGYVLGLYDLLDRFTKHYPDVFLQTCASGGGRFDMGMLYYSSQIQGSDTSDAVDRSFNLYSTSFGYPLAVLGSHVFSNDSTSVATRMAIAFFGTYGFEFNPDRLSEEDRDEIKKAETVYSAYHLDCIQNGDLYRLSSPYQSNYLGMACVSKDQKKAVVLFMNYRRETPLSRFLKVYGLKDDSYYANNLDGHSHSGLYYKNVGLNISKRLTRGNEARLILLDEVD